MGRFLAIYLTVLFCMVTGIGAAIGLYVLDVIEFGTAAPLALALEVLAILISVAVSVLIWDITE